MTASQSATDVRHMLRACSVAKNAIGTAEPNPTVGCVIAIGDSIVAEGWTQAFGGQHAEVHALSLAGDADLSRATLYVTLEPCCHVGKTPACTDAILKSSIKRVVVGTDDPFPQVAGKGIAALRKGLVEVEVGVARAEAMRSLSPYLKVQTQALPWIIAKWAMTLDGKIATSSGSSRWISSSAARRVVHELRGRVDAVAIGIGTALADDPLLTARPPGPRTPTRIVVDSNARLSPTCQLVETANDTPVMLAVSTQANSAAINKLEQRGVEVFRCEGDNYDRRMDSLLAELCKRRMTNVLFEGGGTLLGSLFDRRQIDEVHAFVSPKLCGGDSASTPLGGHGVAEMGNAIELTDVTWRQIGGDCYLTGRCGK